MKVHIFWQKFTILSFWPAKQNIKNKISGKYFITLLIKNES